MAGRSPAQARRAGALAVCVLLAFGRAATAATFTDIGTFVAGEYQVSTPLSFSGANTFNLDFPLRVLSGGSITFAAGTTNTFNITGDFNLDSGGTVAANTTATGQTAGAINFNSVTGNATIAGSLSATGVNTNTNGGAITLNTAGALTLAATGTVVTNTATNNNAAGDINLTAGGAATLHGKVLAETSGAGATAGDIAITAGDDLAVGSTATVSASRNSGGTSGGTAGDLTLTSTTGKVVVHDGGTVKATSGNLGTAVLTITGQAIEIYGPVSVAATRTPGKIELESATTIVIDATGTHSGALTATTVTDNPGGTINVLGGQQVTVAGPTSGVNYAINAAASGTNQAGGTVNIVSTNAGVNMSGQAVRATDTSAGGDGGTVNIQGKEDVSLASGTVLANGTSGNNGLGGTIAVRSYEGGVTWTNGVADASGRIGGTITVTYATALDTSGTTLNVTGTAANGNSSTPQDDTGGTPPLPAGGAIPAAMFIELNSTSVDLGAVVVGGPAPSQNLNVAETGGVGPLDYSLPANPAGFTVADAGSSQSLDADANRNHLVTLDTSTIASYTNTPYAIAHNSQAVTSPLTVTLSAAVLDHAQPTGGTTLDLGAVIIGAPAPSATTALGNAARVDGLRAKLEVSGISGLDPAVVLAGIAVGDKISQGDSRDLVFTGNTTAVGHYDSTLTIATHDDTAVLGAAPRPDTTVEVLFSVVDHAQPSLSSTSATTTGGLALGAAFQSQVSSEDVEVFNADLLLANNQALLEVYDFSIAGDPGFALPSFTPLMVGDGPETITVAFDRTGLTPGSYSAILTLLTRDDPSLAGASNRASLTLSLTGQVVAPNFEAGPVPEPVMLPLLAGAALMLTARRRRSCPGVTAAPAW